MNPHPPPSTVSSLIPNSRASVMQDDDESFDISFDHSTTPVGNSKDNHNDNTHSTQSLPKTHSSGCIKTCQNFDTTRSQPHTTPSKSRITSPVKPGLSSHTMSMFTKLLPNHQLQQRQLQQLTQPITLPHNLPITSLSQPTQQLATFLLDHLQSQQGHLASLQRDLYGMKDVVWAGGLVLQKQQKQLHSLHNTVHAHETSIVQLREEVLQQEARLRAELIYQRQQQALQRRQFSLQQRQTRIDNIFDGSILVIALLFHWLIAYIIY